MSEIQGYCLDEPRLYVVLTLLNTDLICPLIGVTSVWDALAWFRVTITTPN